MTPSRFFQSALEVLGFQKAARCTDVDKVLTEIGGLSFSEEWIRPNPSMFFGDDPIILLASEIRGLKMPYLLKDPSLANIELIKKIKVGFGLSCVPVLDVCGVASSKSSGFNSMRQFASSLNPQHKKLSFTTSADLADNLAIVKERNHPPTIVKLKWSGRTFYLNHDASHHLAAAYRYCMDNNVWTAYVEGNVCEYGISSRAEDFMDRYHILGAYGGDGNSIWRLIQNRHEGLGIPSYYGGGFLIFPKAARKASALLEVLMHKEGVFCINTGDVGHLTLSPPCQIFSPKSRERTASSII